MESAEAKPTPPLLELVQDGPGDESKPPGPLDVTFGLAAAATSGAAAMARGISRVARPLGHVLLHPPLVSEQLHPARITDALAERGREAMASTSNDLERLIAAVVPVVVREVLDALDLNTIIAERLDVDALVGSVDIAGIIERVDVDTIVHRIDINAIASQIDLDAIAERIDLDRIVTRIDIDAIVAAVDLEAIVGRLNVVGLAEDVINEIDLPEIIRDSTGSMASQVVRDARMQSIDADEAVSRLVDKLLRRSRARTTLAQGQQPR